MFRRILWGIIPTLLLGVVACSDDTSSDSFTASPVYGESCSSVIGESSSSVGPAPESSDAVGTSSSEIAQNSSSSVAGESSSSIIANSSSSAKTPKNTAACMWRGFDKKTYVNTGFVNEDIDNYAGLWYNFGDDPDGGMSTVVFPDVCAFETPEYECMENLLEYYGGYSGAAVLEKGILNEAFAGVGFLVAGIENPDDYYTEHIPRYGDISSWGGICVTYAADRDMFLQLGADSVTFYEVKLDKSLEFVEKCVPWSEFVGATAAATSTAAEAAKHAHSIRIVMKSTEETRGHFNIAAIGKFDVTGACEVDGFAEVVTKTNGAEIGTIILRSSSSSGVNGSSSSLAPSGDCVSPESVSEMWYVPRAVDNNDYHVETGLDNGSETSGYWFSFGDEDAAYIKWPVVQYGYEYDARTDLIMRSCNGICGTFKFVKESVTGIGFNIAGVVFHGHNEVPDFADASAWGGLCVTYASEMDMDVAMSNDTTYSYAEKMALMPRVLLPKSTEVKTVCSKWSDFVTYAGTPSNPTQFAAIMFVAYGNAGSESKFNIIGVGKYDDAQNVCKQGGEPFVSGKKGMTIQ